MYNYSRHSITLQDEKSGEAGEGMRRKGDEGELSQRHDVKSYGYVCAPGDNRPE
jgi:hypothetical protein